MKMLNTRHDFVNNKKIDDCQSFILFFFGVLLFLTRCSSGICLKEIEQIFFQQQISDFELPHIVFILAHEFVWLRTNVSTMLAMIIY